MTERTPRTKAPTGMYFPNPSEYMGDPLQPADLSELVWNTPEDPACPVSRACAQINAAIDANVHCTSGLFSRTVCVGTPNGLHGQPTLVALIDADPNSLIDHWYGLVGCWHGKREGMVAGLIRLPMIDAPDIDTLIKRIQHARADAIQRTRPEQLRDGDPCEATRRLCRTGDASRLGSKAQFLSPVRLPDPVFAHTDTFYQAVISLEQKIRRHDRRLRRSPLVWWTNRHPGDRLVDHLSRVRPAIKSPHFWPTLPWEHPFDYPDADVSSPQYVHPLIDLLAACPDRERSVFTRPRIRFANRRDTCPEMLVFAGRHKRGRTWIYGRIEIRESGSYAGLIPMPAFLDGNRGLDLFDVIRKDAGQVHGFTPRKDPPEDVRTALEAELSNSLLKHFGGKPVLDKLSKAGTGATP